MTGKDIQRTTECQKQQRWNHILDRLSLSLSLFYPKAWNKLTAALNLIYDLSTPHNPSAHWLRCFTAASCVQTLQSSENSPRQPVITACRPSGSCCRRHLPTLHLRKNMDACGFPEAIPAASCKCWNVLQVQLYVLPVATPKEEVEE